MISQAASASSTVPSQALSSGISTSTTPAIAPSKTLLITHGEWFTQFKPIINPLGRRASFDGTMYETYGDQVELVRRTVPSQIWTLKTTEDGDTEYISAGWSTVNRIGYFMTENSWVDRDIEVVIDADEHLYELKKYSGGVRGIEKAFTLSPMMRQAFEACKLRWVKPKRN
jgi:hypothetical protein